MSPYIGPMRTLMAVLGLAAALLADDAKLNVTVGKPAPGISLPSLGDERQRLSLRDFVEPSRCQHRKACRPVVLAFWSTSCIPCRKELPRLQAWANAHPNVLFWPILVDGTAETLAGTQALERLGVHALGLHDLYQVAGERYGVCKRSMCNVPALVVVGEDGDVKLAHQGFDPNSNLEAQLDQALRH